jgi:hypothetical protein
MQSTSSILDTDLSGTVTDFRDTYLAVKWLYQRRIVMFTITGPLGLNAVVDVWGKQVRRVLLEWQREQRYYAIHDVSKTNFRVSPALVSTIRELFSLRPDVPRSIAVIVPRNIATQLVRVLLRGYDRGEQVKTIICFSREEALRWLLPQIKDI